MRKSCIIGYVFLSLFFYQSSSYADSLVLWNKLGSEYEVTHSEVGQNGNIVGNISYNNAKFANGFSSGTANNYIEFSNLGLDGNQFTIEFWFKPTRDFQYGAGGSGADNSTFFCGFTPSGDYQYNLNWFAGYGFGNIVTEFGPNRLTTKWQSSNLLKDELYHIAYVADRSLTGYDRLSLFINGIKQQIRIEWADWGNVSAGFDKIWLLEHPYHDINGDFIIDNLKIYDYAKTDFSDRFDENAGGPVPEPATLVLLCAALFGLLSTKKLRR